MIRVDGPPETWAHKVAALMVDRGRHRRLPRFFTVVFHPGNQPEVPSGTCPVHPGEQGDST